MKNLFLTKSKLLKNGYDFVYNGNIRGTLVKFNKEINIQLIESRIQNKGNCQNFIKLFQKELKKTDFTLVSSTPISESWRHICQKYKIKIYEK